MRGGAHATEPSVTSASRWLVNRDTKNAVPLNDAIEHVAALAQRTKDSIPPVQMRLRRVRDEPLATAGVGPGQRHAQGAPLVAMGIQLVPICGGMIAWIWNLVCTCIGLAKAHEIDTWRAVLAVMLPLLVCCAIGAGLMVTLIATVFSVAK